MRVPGRAWLVLAVAVTAGCITLACAATSAGDRPTLGPSQAVVCLLVGPAMVTAWLWPLRLFRDGQAEALHVDEGFFVLMALLLPSWAVIATFASVTMVAQTLRRRPLLKSLFNTGQVVTSAGIGLAVLHRLATLPGRIEPEYLGAAALAALVYVAVNTGAFVAIMTAMGTPASRALLDGLGVRLVLVVGGVITGLVAALAVHDRAWATPLAVVPFVLLPRVLSGRSKAHHDRARLRGLFEATLEANRSADAVAIRDVLTDAARCQLSCAEAAFSDRPALRGLSVPLKVNGRVEWLVASPEGRTAPFDEDDHTLLEALAAVGTTALTNACLYEDSRRQRESLAAITSSLGEGVCAVDLEGRITFVNPAAAELLGWPAEVTSSIPEGAGNERPTAPLDLLLPALKALESGSRVTSFDSRFRRRDGAALEVSYTAAPIAGPDGTQGAVIVFRDITVRKRFEEELARYAFHDSLTGLANRRLFVDHLMRALERSRRSRERHAVLFADVDRFKLFNDGLGHQAGDELLTVIGTRMMEVVRPGDVLARFGGDEFTVLLEGIGHEREPTMVAQRIAEQLGRPIVLRDGHEVVATVSMGIALTNPGDSHDDVIRNADVAMYAAKRRGRVGAYEVFDRDEMGTRSSERIDLEADLRHALERGEIEIHFQPVCSVTGAIRGAEALIRWRHPHRGLLSPAQFVPLAEESGLIMSLGHHVLEESCRWARRWREEFDIPLLVSVNLSGRQFGHAALELELATILEETGVDPHQLCVEITESIAVDDMARTDVTLRGLRHLGVKVAVDDFGTGYSSLAYLNRFPVDVVKIDKSFVEQLGRNKVSDAIVSAVITLSNAIDATTVAEGVETIEQLEILAALDCPRVQGYLTGRPVPAEAMGRLLRVHQGGVERLTSTASA